MSDALDRLSREANLQRQQVAESIQLAREAPGILAGAADEALFGLPEFIARAINDEATENWIRENESGFRKGELVGTIGGSFIPTGALLGRGLGAAGRALQGGGRLGQTIGRGLTTAGRFMTGANMAGRSIGAQVLGAAGRGAVEGGLESGIRAATNRRDVVGEGLTGAGFGAAGGALGEALRQTRRILPELRKGTQGSVLGGAGLQSRNLRQALQRSTGAGSAGARIGRVQESLDDITDFVKRHPDLQHSWGRDDVLAAAYDQTRSMYKKLDELYDANKFSIRRAMEEKLTTPTPETEDLLLSTPGAREMLTSLSKRVDAARTMGAKRKTLENIIERTDPARVSMPTEKTQAEFLAARMLRDELDDQVNNLARASGVPDLQQAGKDWKALQALSGSEMRTMSQVPGTGTGSPTFEKALAGSVIGGAAGFGGSSADDPDRIRNTLLTALGGGLAGSALSKTSGKLLQALGTKADDILEAATKNPQIMNLLSTLGRRVGRPIAQAAGRGGASALAAQSRAQQAEYMPGSTVREPQQLELFGEGATGQGGAETLASNPEAQAAQVGEATADRNENPSRYEYLVTQKLYERFAMTFPEYANDAAAFQEFIGYARQASNNFDPTRTAELLFPHPDERKAYLDALENQKFIRQGIGSIRKEEGIGGIIQGIMNSEDLESRGARETVQGAFVNAAKAANIPSKDAEAIFNRILYLFPNNPRAREAAIYDQMERWNARGFRNLRQAGII